MAYRRSVQAEDRLGYVRYLPCRRSKSHNVDIGVAPRVVEGFISDFRIHQFSFPCANCVQNRFPLSMSKHLQLEHTRSNRVTEPVTRAFCKPHFHLPAWMVRMPPASHFITVERASTVHFSCWRGCQDLVAIAPRTASDRGSAAWSRVVNGDRIGRFWVTYGHSSLASFTQSHALLICPGIRAMRDICLQRGNTFITRRIARVSNGRAFTKRCRYCDLRMRDRKR
jgi:hypothetical protein